MHAGGTSAIDDAQCRTDVQVHRIGGGKGFNFRSASLQVDPESGAQVRRLTKYYGVRVVFRVGGTGGKFDAAALGMVLGSGLGLLGVATVVADMLLYSSERTRICRAAKFEKVRGTDQCGAASGSSRVETADAGDVGAGEGAPGASLAESNQVGGGVGAEAGGLDGPGSEGGYERLSS